ncbi:MAG: hypothetical protein D6766_11180, partial [Verrucomicrobia bacterium]
AEFLAGTDPMKPDAPLRLRAIFSPTGQVTLRFRMMTGRSYRIEYSDDLGAGDWQEWTVVGPAVSDRDAAVAVPEAASTRARFFRLVEF